MDDLFDNAVRKAEPPIRTVTQLTRLIRMALEGSFTDVRVEGEVSNLRIPASGHCYFTLKDENAQISAVIWKTAMRGLKVKPEEGMAVRLTGSITVFEKSGQYQISVRQAELRDAKGDLLRRFEALKARLQAEGLFAPERKRPLPMLPRHIAVVTSPTGAAIRDILKVFDRRFPNLHIVIAPARVQGDGAAQDIAFWIERLNAMGGFDAMIVGRGGGSIEDLWCFNEEAVARAVAASRIPVISAVGHETDFTICDFVADVRAPTPSAAAEIVVGRKADLEAHLAAFARRLGRGLEQRKAWAVRLDTLARSLKAGTREAVGLARRRLEAASGSHGFREPLQVVRHGRERLMRWEAGLIRAVEGRSRGVEQQLDALAARLGRAPRATLEARRTDVAHREAQLRALNPLAILTRGYSVTLDGQGRVVQSVQAVEPGMRLRTRVADGEFQSEVMPHDTQQ
jgi:exodeoxyribonuclease VII large subunit